MSGFCAVLQGFSARKKVKKGSVGFEDEWVDSNLVYQEYIKDRHHIHLSGTRWKSVAGFVRFLGQKGIAEIKRKKMNISSSDSDAKYIFGETGGEESEEEVNFDSEEEEEVFEKDPTKRPKWFIKLIDKSPEAILTAKSKAAAVKKVSEEESLQARQMALVEKKAAGKVNENLSNIPKIISIFSTKQSQQQQEHKPPPPIKKVASIFEESSSSDEEQEQQEKVQKKNLVLAEIADEEMRFKKEKSTEPVQISYFPEKSIEIFIEEDEEIPWIRKGLLIKVGNESIGDGKYLNSLAVIDQVIDDFGSQVTVLKNGDQLLLDQDDCLPVSRVSDEEYDQQLSTIDPKIMSTALKTDRCIVLFNGFKGKEGRVLGSLKGNEYKIEISAAGTSQIHRKQFNLVEGQFCIYWE